ncbi:hypothetical protein [Draconibacterium orientale]|uniref:Uncharacterized protein n=1 Tax=Draconibacterium orientale TaxID=1168034 RepID=A0ABM5QFG1_9BACT|nr:hypothetical protein [Draconibacterium orientale]AHW62367.1 hypothetical protein FH5T_20385 [Draconibacterium orientale]
MAKYFTTKFHKAGTKFHKEEESDSGQAAIFQFVSFSIFINLFLPQSITKQAQSFTKRKEVVFGDLQFISFSITINLISISINLFYDRVSQRGRKQFSEIYNFTIYHFSISINLISISINLFANGLAACS